MRLAERDRPVLGGRRCGAGEVRAGDQHGVGALDQRRVDVALVQGGVGTVGAIEDQREAVLVADAEDDQRGEPARVGRHPGDIDALANQLLADEAAHVLVADAGDDRRAQAEPCGADRDVRGASADGLRKARHILEPAADLLAVEVDG